MKKQMFVTVAGKKERNKGRIKHSNFAELSDLSICISARTCLCSILRFSQSIYVFKCDMVLKKDLSPG